MTPSHWMYCVSITPLLGLYMTPSHWMYCVSILSIVQRDGFFVKKKRKNLVKRGGDWNRPLIGSGTAV